LKVGAAIADGDDDDDAAAVTDSPKASENDSFSLPINNDTACGSFNFPLNVRRNGGLLSTTRRIGAEAESKTRKAVNSRESTRPWASTSVTVACSGGLMGVEGSVDRKLTMEPGGCWD
jgi:hypothetical protein